jgi:hypothetical protein
MTTDAAGKMNTHSQYPVIKRIGSSRTKRIDPPTRILFEAPAIAGVAAVFCHDLFQKTPHNPPANPTTGPAKNNKNWTTRETLYSDVPKKARTRAPSRAQNRATMDPHTRR